MSDISTSDAELEALMAELDTQNAAIMADAAAATSAAPVAPAPAAAPASHEVPATAATTPAPAAPADDTAGLDVDLAELEADLSEVAAATDAQQPAPAAAAVEPKAPKKGNPFAAAARAKLAKLATLDQDEGSVEDTARLAEERALAEAAAEAEAAALELAQAEAAAKARKEVEAAAAADKLKKEKIAAAAQAEAEAAAKAEAKRAAEEAAAIERARVAAAAEAAKQAAAPAPAAAAAAPEVRRPTADTAPGAGPLRHTINVEQFQRDTRVTEATLDHCMTEQAGLRAFYGTQAAQAEAQASRAKARFEVMEAKLYDLHRKELTKTEEKVTEKMVEGAVKQDPRWLAAKNLMIDAETIAAMNKSLVDSLRDRKDMLVQLGADRREGMKGQLRVLQEQGDRESLASRATNLARESMGLDKKAA